MGRCGRGTTGPGEMQAERKYHPNLTGPEPCRADRPPLPMGDRRLRTPAWPARGKVRQMPEVRCAEAACVHNDACGGCEANSIYVSSIGRTGPACMTLTTVATIEAGHATDATAPSGAAHGTRGQAS